MSSIGQHLLLSTANFQNADKVLPLAIQERCFAASYAAGADLQPVQDHDECAGGQLQAEAVPSGTH